MWISSVNGTRWRAGWRWGQGLTRRGYEVTGLFSTGLCDKYSSIHHPRTQTHTWKLPTLFLLNILCSFVTQRWSSSEVYFPHMSLWKPGFGDKKHNKSRNKNSIHIKISINHTCTYSRSTIAFFGYWKQEIDSMFNHQWLLNTDQIIKKSKTLRSLFFWCSDY